MPPYMDSFTAIMAASQRICDSLGNINEYYSSS